MVKQQSHDTSLTLEETLFERYRQMSIEEKLDHIGALGRLAEELAVAGLRAKYPEASYEESRMRLVSRWIDRDTMIRLYGWDPDERGR
jgi:deoxyribodipyrimidine photolyase-like uncharacterized protein